jgi:hypothetical protein
MIAHVYLEYVITTAKSKNELTRSATLIWYRRGGECVPLVITTAKSKNELTRSATLIWYRRGGECVPLVTLESLDAYVAWSCRQASRYK